MSSKHNGGVFPDQVIDSFYVEDLTVESDYITQKRKEAIEKFKDKLLINGRQNISLYKSTCLNLK